MLNIYSAGAPGSRRRFLTVGGLALGGLSLASARAGEGPTRLATGRSVIFLFQQGGPSQLETFDPKPDAPAEVRTVTGVTRTALPGSPSATRSSASRGWPTSSPSSAPSRRQRRTQHPPGRRPGVARRERRLADRQRRRADAPLTSMPTSAVLFPQAVSPDAAKGQGAATSPRPARSGRGFAPFVPGGGGQLQKDLRLALAPEQFHSRRSLLAGFDRLRETADR
jgi:hypothetical protein